MWLQPHFLISHWIPDIALHSFCIHTKCLLPAFDLHPMLDADLGKGRSAGIQSREVSGQSESQKYFSLKLEVCICVDLTYTFQLSVTHRTVVFCGYENKLLW